MPSIPKVKLSKMTSVKMPSIRSENAYLVYLFCAVGIILTAMCIPYLFSLFVPTPFCDTGKLEEIKGSYAVLNGVVPLENIMKCRQCPYGAKCADGRAECDANYHLDDFQVQCLSKMASKATDAALIAHRVWFHIFALFNHSFFSCDFRLILFWENDMANTNVMEMTMSCMEWTKIR